MNDTAWRDFALFDDVRSERKAAPRASGLTMAIDTGYGLHASEDMLQIGGKWIDHWKLSFGTSIFGPERVVRKKIESIKAAGVLVYPGGTLFEATIVRHKCRIYMQKLTDLGFGGVEVSDGTIELPADRRKRVVECALEAGLTVVTEVGKKDPNAQPLPEELAEQALLDLDWGASWVIVEGRESGKGVGVYGSAGEVDMGAIDKIAEVVGDSADRLIWEAPIKSQQVALISRFGINVNLGNIDPQRVLALEALRSGLRFETLQPIANQLQQAGEWSPLEQEGS